MSLAVPEGPANSGALNEFAIDDPISELTIYDRCGDMYADVCEVYAHESDPLLLAAVHDAVDLLSQAHGLQLSLIPKNSSAKLPIPVR